MENTEKKDWKYKVEHIGDVFADGVHYVCTALKSSTRGIVLTYNIYGYELSMGKLKKGIGGRLMSLRKESPGIELPEDEQLSSLIEEFDDVESRCEAAYEEREEKLHRRRPTAEPSEDHV